MDDDFGIVDELEADYVQKRPDFLTVLCILTWVGCGIWMVYGYFQLSVLGFASEFVSTPEIRWHKWSAMATIVMPLFCIAGSILMWNQKRIGFFIYLFGQAVPVLLSIYMTLVVMKMNGASMFFMIVWNVVPIAFTVMYAVNLQYMRK